MGFGFIKQGGIQEMAKVAKNYEITTQFPNVDYIIGIFKSWVTIKTSASKLILAHCFLTR